MMALDTQQRQARLEEHLELLQSLARELERAMGAITRNALGDLEDSIAVQQGISGRLTDLARHLGANLRSPAVPLSQDDASLRQRILAANASLEQLNRRYAALLQHSSRSVAMMVSLFSSFSGQFQEGSGLRSKQQTWSCQV